VALGVFGIGLFALAVKLSVSKSWQVNLYAIDTSGFLGRLSEKFEIYLYIFAVFIMGMGGLLYMVAKQRKKQCTLSYVMFLPFVIIIFMAISIPPLIIFLVTEEKINNFCTQAKAHKLKYGPKAIMFSLESLEEIYQLVNGIDSAFITATDVSMCKDITGC